MWRTDGDDAERLNESTKDARQFTPLTAEEPEELPSLGDQAVWLQRDLGWEQLVEEARRLGPDPDLRDQSDQELEQQVGLLAGELAALTARWLTVLCEFVVRGTWADQGARTPAEWLSWKVGLATGTAREQVRVALRLRELPRINAAFAAGTLSYSKVRALTRIAIPEIEDLLLQWAKLSTAAQLERIAADFRHTQQIAHPRDDNGASDYSWRTRTHADGTMTVTIRGPVEECAELCEAIERRVDQQEADAANGAQGREASGARDQDPIIPEAAYHVVGSENDAAVRGGRDRAAAMVGELLQVVVAVADGAVDTSGLDRHTLVLHAPLAELASAVEDTTDDAPDPGRRESVVPDEHEPVAVYGARGRVRALPRHVLQRIACEAGLVLAAVGERGTPVDIGRRDRRLTVALRRAVQLRDRDCRFPSCGATRHLHVHHARHWADGGSTDLDNLVLLCSRHHRFVHERGWSITVGPDPAHRFYDRDGRLIPHRCPLQPPAVRSRLPLIEARGLEPIDFDRNRALERDTIVAVLQQEITHLAPDLAAA